MSKFRIIIYSLLSFIGIVTFAFAIGLLNLGFQKFFRPKQENINREVFENTKSYDHGKIQDLAKYYREYQETEDVDSKTAIRILIQSQFAEFPADRIDSPQLRAFLINMRGF